MIALIDYGAGNLTSVRKALSALGAAWTTPRSPAALADARGIIVPGVGHFDSTRAIGAAWRDAIRGALDRGTSLFGICLGMQWLFDGSIEAADVPGLGYFAGVCTRLDQQPTARSTGGTHGAAIVGRRLKVPHVGWNSLALPKATRLMANVPQDAQVYFTHSYVAPVTADAAAVTTYGAPFAAAVERGRVAGVQFHPEKSGDVGLRILRNWLDTIAPAASDRSDR